MTIPAFNTDFGDEFQVYDPHPEPANPIGWRAMVRANGITRNISDRTRMDFVVETGRDDPEEQPGPGRATFTLDTTGGDRLAWLSPGAAVWLDAETGSGANRLWRRIWTGTVTDVRRAFGWTAPDAAGERQPRNTVAVDATGPLAALERLRVPAGVAGAFPEQLDGMRVWTLLYQLKLPMDTVRPESGHLVNDELPEHTSRWDQVTDTVAGAEAAVFTRTATIPDVTGAGTAARRCEVVVSLTVSRACVVVVSFAGATAEYIYLDAGSHAVTGAVAPATDVDDPTLQVTVIPIDQVWANTKWSDLDEALTWTGLPADRNWTAAPAAGQTTTVTVHTVDVWQSGWDWGAVWLIARDPDAGEGQTARDHVEEIARAARGTLWEQRAGGLQWASQLSRAADVAPSLDLPSWMVRADTESTQTLSGLVNRVTVEYGWSGMTSGGEVIPRPSVTLTDQGSIDAFGGMFEATIAGPLRDRQSAVAVAQAVLRASARPRERISQLVTVPLHTMDDPTVQALLTVTPGALVEVEYTPDGWVPSNAASWRGFLEGWSINGGTGADADGRARAVTVTLAVSEYFEGLSTLVSNATGDLLKAHPR